MTDMTRIKNVIKPITMILVAAVVISVPCARHGYTAPKPSEAKIAWQLDITFQPPMAIRMQIPPENKERTYWYMLYTVSNNTGADRLFVPDFDLYTDTGMLVRSGKKIPTKVFQAIKNLHNDPLMVSMANVTGKILQGKDNAKSSVAIWRDFDPKAGAFDVFIGGLSGETAIINLPKPVEAVETDAGGKKKTVQKTTLLLSRTLKLHYNIPGESTARMHTTVKPAGKTWVMR